MMSKRWVTPFYCKKETYMKQELLEYIIRACASEVLEQLKEEDDTKGAPAPPASGQGTADQPEIPKTEKPTDPEEPTKPETPEVPPSPELKGIVFVNPKDKSKLQKIDLKAGDDAALERNLHRLGASVAGAKVKTALSTTRMVKDVVRNPHTSVYLYIGKYDPQSDELFLMADKSLQVAKDSSVPAAEISTGAAPLSPDVFNPLTAGETEYAKHLAAQGQNVPQPVDENLRKAIKVMVEKILDTK